MSTKPIKLFWSRGYGKDSESHRNFGDWMSPLLCEAISGRPVEYASPLKCELFAIGSILNRSNKTHRFHRFGLSRPVDIWGSGSLKESHVFTGKHRFHCVRGKLTHARIKHAPNNIAYGDPGLLCEELLPKRSSEKHYSIGFVPHEEDKNNQLINHLVSSIPQATLIDVHAPVKDVLQNVSQCELVLSSSLHGLIVSDALQVPNGQLILSDRLTGGGYKFSDYYSCFGIDSPEPINLSSSTTLPEIESALADYQRPGLEAVKTGIRKSFPY